MGEKINFEKSTQSMKSVIDFDNGIGAEIKRVIAYKNNKEIFSDDVTVSISNCNIYYKVNIMWDESISEEEYHNKGLYGYYSTDYYEMEYSCGDLTIYGDNGIVITIMA